MTIWLDNRFVFLKLKENMTYFGWNFSFSLFHSENGTIKWTRMLVTTLYFHNWLPPCPWHAKVSTGAPSPDCTSQHVFEPGSVPRCMSFLYVKLNSWSRLPHLEIVILFYIKIRQIYKCRPMYDFEKHFLDYEGI